MEDTSEQTGDTAKRSLETRPTRRRLLGSVGAASAVGVGLFPERVAAVGCNDQYWADWDCAYNAGYDTDGLVGTWITSSSTYDGSYEHCFRITSHRISRGEYMTEPDDKVYDIGNVEVYAAEDYGVSSVQIDHAGASPGEHSNALGYGSPDYEGNPFDRARNQLVVNTDRTPELNDWHYDRYEEGSSSITNGVRFSYPMNDEVADHAHQVVMRVRTDYSAEFAIADHGEHVVSGEPRLILYVDTSGTTLNGTLEPNTNAAGDRC